MNEKQNSEPDVRIADWAEQTKDAAGRTVAVISEARALEAAAHFNTHLARIYTAALQSNIWPVRYLRNAACLSTLDQLKLARAAIAVVGAGGLGGHIAVTCARMGIGRIIIADPDVFEESNLNRQMLATADSLGANKAQSAEKAIAVINPATVVAAHPVSLTEQNAGEILSKADVAADALDSVSVRMTLARACRQAGIPLVHGAIAGFEGQVMTVFPEDAGLEAIYGDKAHEPASGASPEAVLGVPGVTPALTAALQVMEIVKILLNRGRFLKNRMLYTDLENAGFQEFSFDNSPSGDDRDQG